MAALVLIGGDLLVLLLFVLAGRRDHGMDFSWTASLETALPFALGWLIALALVRTYRPAAYAGPGKAALYALLTCCIAVPLGLIFRSVWLGRLPNGSFAVVAFPLIAAFMTVWRVLFALVRGRLR